MTTSHSTCLICGLPFDARTSYGLCPLCINPTTLKEFDRLQSAIKRAKQLNVPATLTLVQHLATVSDYRGLCAYCGELPHCTIDMVDPLMGLIWENAVPICRCCQVHKRNGFDTAIRRVKQYLSANASRDESDANLEYLYENDEPYMVEPAPN